MLDMFIEGVTNKSDVAGYFELSGMPHYLNSAKLIQCIRNTFKIIVEESIVHLDIMLIAHLYHDNCYKHP